MFSLITFGKIRPKPLAAAEKEYCARLSKRLRFEKIELRDEKIDSRPAETIKSAEAARFLKTVRPEDHVVALDERGTRITTETLAQRLSDWPHRVRGRVVFVIGGALGLGEEILDRANETWRLSDLVMAGGVARIVLLEALYRADSINRNEPYHNA